MSYIISPIKDSEKVTYEVQYKPEHYTKWHTASRADTLDELIHPMFHANTQTRVIQRTESIALVLREGEYR